mmetsp:Transcript_24125/g.57044  ORF Transcript_24125/g.57044 Transcript_24125/m.57044 type:complete len:202 (+) Transcript_24125:565-1170(+)
MDLTCHQLSHRTGCGPSCCDVVFYLLFFSFYRWWDHHHHHRRRNRLTVMTTKTDFRHQTQNHPTSQRWIVVVFFYYYYFVAVFLFFLAQHRCSCQMFVFRYLLLSVVDVVDDVLQPVVDGKKVLVVVVVVVAEAGVVGMVGFDYCCNHCYQNICHHHLVDGVAAGPGNAAPGTADPAVDTAAGSIDCIFLFLHPHHHHSWC